MIYDCWKDDTKRDVGEAAFGLSVVTHALVIVYQAPL